MITLSSTHAAHHLRIARIALEPSRDTPWDAEWQASLKVIQWQVQVQQQHICLISTTQLPEVHLITVQCNPIKRVCFADLEIRLRGIRSQAYSNLIPLPCHRKQITELLVNETSSGGGALHPPRG